MTVTKGQGNPNWTRDETILALDLYFQFEGKIPGPKHEKVVELSRILNTLPIHPIELRKANFRNPDGVVFKLQNLRSVATGKGLYNTSKMDKSVWQDFKNNKDEVLRISANIKNCVVQFEEHDELDLEIDDNETFSEGKIITAIHKRRERSSKIRKEIIKKRKASNTLFCDICGITTQFNSPVEDTAIFECHHINLLSQTGEVKTKIEDVAFICANCHRALHSLIVKEKRWIKPDEIKKLTIASS